MIDKNKLYWVVGEKNNEFFKRIDKFGGWPVDKKFVQYYHRGESETGCVFSTYYTRNEFWTTIATSDEYYVWKLSPEAIRNIKLEARAEIIREIGGIAP